MAVTAYAPVSWQRMSDGVEKVRLRAADALNRAKIPYAVGGDIAVAAWVSRVDEAAVRNTQDVDIVLRRVDLPAARQALELAGFVYRHAASMDMFLDGQTRKPGTRSTSSLPLKRSVKFIPRPRPTFQSRKILNHFDCSPSTPSCG